MCCQSKSCQITTSPSLLESRFGLSLLFQILKKSLYERMSVNLFHHRTEQNNNVSFMCVCVHPRIRHHNLICNAVCFSQTKTQVQASRRVYLVCDGIHSSNSNHFLDSLPVSLLSHLCVHTKTEDTHTRVRGL